MYGYIIKRMDAGRAAYATRPGSQNSYTRDIRGAQRFPTREAAEASGVCGNERVVSIESEFNG